MKSLNYSKKNNLIYMDIYLGTSGWYYDHWIGKFYPENIDKSDWLKYYSKRFETVEVNASFYRLPFPNMVKGWKNKTPDNFLLTFKGSQIITHRKRLKDIDDYLEKFYSRMNLAEDKIGIILWQLPPSLERNDDLLKTFLKKIDSNFRQVIEFRHKSWFNKEVYQILRDYDVGYCIVSCPDLPTHFETTSDFAYIRWHGEDEWYRTSYTKQQLDEWAKKIKKLDVNEIYGYFNNDYQGFAPENCSQLKQIFEK
ncbi:MAG: DUF72 domain-containing protein [Candidatus Thermoplasmatota archaeon]